MPGQNQEYQDKLKVEVDKVCKEQDDGSYYCETHHSTFNDYLSARKHFIKYHKELHQDFRRMIEAEEGPEETFEGVEENVSL